MIQLNTITKSMVEIEQLSTKQLNFLGNDLIFMAIASMVENKPPLIK
jgi:hypothetical protein